MPNHSYLHLLLYASFLCTPLQFACEPQGFTSESSSAFDDDDDDNRIPDEEDGSGIANPPSNKGIAAGRLQVFSASQALSAASLTPALEGGAREPAHEEARKIANMLQKKNIQIFQIKNVIPAQMVVSLNGNVRKMLPRLQLELQAKYPEYTLKVTKCIYKDLCLIGIIKDENKVSKKETLYIISMVNSMNIVRYAEPNLKRYAMRVPRDPYYEMQWNYPAMFLEGAWEITTGSRQIVGAVLDSGFMSNQDFSRVLPGYDFVSEELSPMDGDGWDNDPFDSASKATNIPSHGTHVAGVMLADGDNDIGISGVDWQGFLLPIRGLGAESGSSFDLSAGLLWAVGETIENTPLNENPADVINCSFGAQRTTQIERESFSTAVQRAIIIAASGNENIDASTSYPASHPGVISVAALDALDQRAPYSNFGASIDIAAPGGDQTVDANGDGQPDGILSYVTESTANFMQGTSMASPHVAGVALLAKAVRPQLSAAEFKEAIQQTAYTNVNCPEGCGAGLIHAERVLQFLSGEEATGFSVSPSSITLSELQNEAVYRISNNTQDSILYQIESNNPALSFAPELIVNAQSSVSFSVVIDRAIAAIGTAQLVFTTENNTRQASLQWNNTEVSALETIYVSLIQRQGESLVEIQSAQVFANENFNFSLQAPAGEYYLIAVADDNKNGIYEEGESFSIYPSIENPAPIQLQNGQALQGLNFQLSPAFQEPDVETPINTQTGEACTANNECEGNICIDSTNGYCSMDCSQTLTCTENSSCFYIDETQTTAYCFKNCTSDADCRTGEQYGCYLDYGICDSL